MAQANVNDLKRRCEARGLLLFTDSDNELYIADPKTGRMVGVHMEHDTADDVLNDLEEYGKKVQATTSETDAKYEETNAERRERITKDGDVNAAIREAERV